MNELTEKTNPAIERIVSIDVLRGLTIFLMIFVNDISGVHGAPGWLKHVSASTDGMGVADIVLPAFLFIMGMSIPIALGRRLESGQHRYSTAKHIFVRSLSLLIIGVLMVNYPDSKTMGWPDGLWNLLLVMSIFMAWHRISESYPSLRRPSFFIRIAGILLIIILTCVFKDNDGNRLQAKWWGILGLIGWSYLIASALYVMSHGRIMLLTGALVLLLCVYGAFREGLFSSGWVNGGTIGSLPSIAVAGAVLGTIIRKPRFLPRQKILWASVFCSFLALGAWLTRPFYGISKITATPSWCLWSSAVTGITWIILYRLIDIGERGGNWLKPLKLAGANALFAYLFASLVYNFFWVAGIGYFTLNQSAFPIGLNRALLFAIFVTGFSGWAGRHFVKLKL